MSKEEINELKEDIKEMKEYPIKLSWSKLWAVIVTITTIAGGLFGLGVRVQFEVSKFEMIKMEQTHFEKMSEIKNKLLESERKQKENFENMTFFQNQYNIYKDRFEKCLAGETYTKSL